MDSRAEQKSRFSLLALVLSIAFVAVYFGLLSDHSGYAPVLGIFTLLLYLFAGFVIVPRMISMASELRKNRARRKTSDRGDSP